MGIPLGQKRREGAEGCSRGNNLPQTGQHTSTIQNRHCAVLKASSLSQYTFKLVIFNFCGFLAACSLVQRKVSPQIFEPQWKWRAH